MNQANLVIDPRLEVNIGFIEPFGQMLPGQDNMICPHRRDIRIVIRIEKQRDGNALLV